MEQPDAQRPPPVGLSDGTLAAFWKTCHGKGLAEVQAEASALGLGTHDIRRGGDRPLLEACAGGNLDTVRWLVGRLGLEAKDVSDGFAVACKRGHLRVACWLAERFGLTAEDVREAEGCVLRWACANGHLSVVAWLVGYFGLSADDFRAHGGLALCWAQVGGTHDTLTRWIGERFGVTAAGMRAARANRDAARRLFACRSLARIHAPKYWAA